MVPTLTAAERTALDLLGRLPWLTAAQVTVISGLTAVWPVRERLTGLHRRGLLQALPARGISPTGRRAFQPQAPGRDDATVWAPTDTGLAALAWIHGTDPRAIAASRGLTAARLTALLLALPTVSAGYTLLVAACRGRPGRPQLWEWAQPWPMRAVWTVPDHPGRLALPAAATLAWSDDALRVREARRVLLLPDVGALPVAALAPVVRRLARRLADAAEPPATTDQPPPATMRPPVLVLATSEPLRQRAWERRLAALALPSLVLTWAEVEAGQLRLPPTPADHARRPVPLAGPGWRPAHQGRPLPAIIAADPGCIAGAPAGTLARRGARLSRLEQDALLLLAGHPGLPLATWAQLRGQSLPAFRASVARPLLAARLIRHLTVDELPEGTADDGSSVPPGLMEVTAAGLTLLAAQAGVSLPAAVRWAGWAGGGPATPVGARRMVVGTLAHTLGIYRLLAALHAPLVAQRFAPDDALIDWLPSTARHGPGIRPDASGRIRHLGREYPFFLEYERGGNALAQVSAKLLAYERSMRADNAVRARLGRMPPILLVTAQAGTETRLASLAAALWPEPATAVPLLLTSEEQLLADTAGWLGRIWRSAWSPDRRYWPWEVEQAVRRQRQR